MALGNSLSVASPLLCDAYKAPHHYETRRIVGNIGRAGVASFVPPKVTQIKDPSAEDWLLVRHAPSDDESIDGQFQSNHASSFIHWFETPLTSDRFDHRDVEIFQPGDSDILAQ